jgi:hypothetical protein
MQAVAAYKHSPKNIPIIWLGATAWTMMAWKVEGREVRSQRMSH